MSVSRSELSFLSSLILLASCAVVTAHLDFHFEFRLKELPTVCRDINRLKTHRCRIPYALHLLSAHEDAFDLNAIMMQDGHAAQRRGLTFAEDTVVRMPTSLIESNEDTNFLVGLKLYGLPPKAQDYFIIDVSKLTKGYGSKTAMQYDNVNMKFKAAVNTVHVFKVAQQYGCSCAGYTCGCCEHLDIPKIELNETGCANITYLAQDKGFSLTFSINGYVLLNETFSLRNPPPICFNVPHLKEYASLCLALYNLSEHDRKFSGCIRLEAELYHVRIYERDLGCFEIPLLLEQ